MAAGNTFRSVEKFSLNVLRVLFPLPCPLCGKGVPFTNYGVAIAHCVGILERALLPFPGIYSAYKNAGPRE